ncbi:MAG: tRNA uridine-5-carboxymethylaminomethyl(34) synthesis GTPase MnmE [Dehalococcoidia bacterium]|nr:tRNA uridine-5-carboxymethylaminomethyl(34) synthesis GTPase MnmE [Dehalococcoidia bacterium]
MYQDTIAAISTPLGEGGIGIVRLSGPDALGIAQKLFNRRLSNRRLLYGHIIDPDNEEVIDEVLVTYMAAPHTYTREDIVEINCHGGHLPLQRILGLVLRYGARMANQGEFTLRAFLNGRIDLAQAESVLDVVRAKTAASLRVAVQGLGGKLSESLKMVRNELMSILAYLTARIDFPDDEVEKQEIVPPLERARQVIGELISSADQGMVYRQGVRTAIVGRRNVGKSSLLNRLLGQSRAIVTPVPGTTRDTLEEVVNLKGVPFVLVDTAGIVQSKGVVESLGVERSRRAIDEADFVLLVIDTSAPLKPSDKEIMGLLSEKEVLVVANKCDLPRRAALDHLPWATVSISALTGEGLDDLEEKMVASVLGGKVFTSNALLVSNPRHKACLERAEAHLDQALSSIEAQMPDDFVTIDLTAALNALGEITGETVTEELLETIFSRFCIGK